MMVDREFTKKNTSLAINELDKELSFMECKEGSSGDKDKEDVVNKVTAWSSPVNDIHYPSEKLVKDNLDLKEDRSNKVTGWVNDVDNNQYPSAKLVKDSLDNLNVNVVQMDIPEPGCSRSYAIKQGNVVLLPKINIPELGIVVDDHLDSVSVNPVQNKVIYDAIPVKTSDIVNDGADGTHPFISDVSGKEDKSNKVSSVDVFSSDEQYPSAKALFGEVSKLGLSIEKQGTADDGFAFTYVFSQGGVELPTKINIPKISIVDDLNSDDSSKVLSAKQGNVLETNKIDKGSIVDNLTTDDATKVLSAKQGKVLADMIGGIEEDMLL